jgi:aerobic-type carbon monoxide dehydrogenase small subunit (CoxS/CutS family)
MPVRFLLNGAPHEVDPRPGESLLETLRVRCGVTSLKDGCSPQGQCGCCLALIDGNPKVTCAVPAEKAEGASILTLDGVAQEERDLLARAFAANAAVQCGFCIPGMALRAKHLVDHNPSPTPQEIARAIDVHLCRCTGYVKIIDAIRDCSPGRAGVRGCRSLCTTGTSGSSLDRYQASDSCWANRPYVADLDRPGMLHGAVVLSPHARARVRADRTSPGEGAARRRPRRHRRRRAGQPLVRPPVRRLAGVRRRRRRSALRGGRARGGRRERRTPRARPRRSSRSSTSRCRPCSIPTRRLPPMRRR